MTDNLLRAHHLQKYAGYIVLLFLFSSSQAYALSLPKDSLIYKDTLTRIEHIRTKEPVRFGIGGSYGINYYQDGALPALLSPGCDTFKSGKGNGLNLLAGIAALPSSKKI